TTLGRHANDAARTVRLEQDVAARAPGSRRPSGITQRLNLASCDINSFECPSGAERHELIIRRPEGLARVSRAGQRPRDDGIERANPKKRLTATWSRNERQFASVRRQGHDAAARKQGCVFSRRDEKAEWICVA